MMQKAWSSIEEVPYCFFWSSIKFQGHTGWKIDDLNPIWVRLLGRSQLSNPSDLPCSYGYVLTIYPYSSGLLHWHWDNHMIVQWSNPEEYGQINESIKSSWYNQKHQCKTSQYFFQMEKNNIHISWDLLHMCQQAKEMIPLALRLLFPLILLRTSVLIDSHPSADTN